jgi:pimeloyl-ACP methyl ester carboxylesterase
MRGGGEDYVDASGGSGDALLEALASFAQQSGTPGLARVPLLLYGHSAGAQFAFNFALWKPDRVLGIVCIKSGPLSRERVTQAPRFPALFIVGEHDEPGRVREVAKAYAIGRSRAAPWCLALQPNAGHGFEKCQDLAGSFMRSINVGRLRANYRELAAPARPLETSAGVTKDPHRCWLPDAEFSREWRRFVKRASLPHLESLPEPAPAPPLIWRAISPLPVAVEHSAAQVGFSYEVALPLPDHQIVDVSVATSHPAFRVQAFLTPAKKWRISGRCDLKDIPLGPLKTHLSADIRLEDGTAMQGELPLFTRVTGKVSVSPVSLYYGVLARDTKVPLDLVVRSEDGLQIRSVSTISSDPAFLSVSETKRGRSGDYAVKCIVRAGARVGQRSGKIILKVTASEQEYQLTVPYYGFVKK